VFGDSDGEDQNQGAFHNVQFVGKFFEFISFEQAADFIYDWIKVKKHNATEFTQDYPALIGSALEFKKELKEGKKQKFSEDQIMAVAFELSDSDYIVKFSLGLLGACSQNSKVPNLIARIILNNLAIMISDS
jgi:hypothetical protein